MATGTRGPAFRHHFLLPPRTGQHIPMYEAQGFIPLRFLKEKLNQKGETDEKETDLASRG